MLTRRWRHLGFAMDEADFTHAHAVVALVRITDGNLCLLHRGSVHIESTLRINGLNAITEDMVQATRSTLVIGVT